MNTNEGGVSIGEMQLYGHEQGDVSTDVTLSSVYNKPGTQQLEVYWDANDSNSYPGSGTTVTDLSENGRTGTISGAGFDSTYNAFTFDGSNDTITTTYPSSAGDNTFSASMWVKRDSDSGAIMCPFFLGDEATGEGIGMDIYATGDVYWFIFNGRRFHFERVTDAWFPVGVWTHVAASHTAGTDFVNLNKVWINGVDVGVGNDPHSGNANNLSLDANDTLTLGARANNNYLNGSIANFRIFSKALSAAQVEELYDWQKDHFLGSRSSMTLYRGNLGFGVAEPTSRLEIAGDQRIQEYPPRAMTSGENYMNGHGVFKARWSNWYDGNTRWGMYNKLLAVGDQANIWYGPYQGNNGYSGGDVYSGTDFAASTTSGLYLDDVNGSRYHGAWTTIEMPYDILLKGIHLYQGAGSEGISSRCVPEDGVILGSDNGSDWHHVHTFTGLQYGGSVGSYSFKAAGERVAINATTPYRHYALVTTRTLHYAFTVIIGELKWFGTPASSTLDDGHMTLGKTLTTSRISGHAVVGAETPRAESLIAHLDTTTGSSADAPSGGGAMRTYDSSGLGNNATFFGDALYDAADRSFKFDGTGDYILRDESPGRGGCRGFPTGDAIYSMSAWVYVDGTQPANFSQIVTFGSAWAQFKLASMYVEGGNKLGADIGSNTCKTTNAVISDKTWHHVAMVKKGTGQISTSMFDLYVDGVAITDKTVAGTGTQSLDHVEGFSVGMAFNASNDPLIGRISNPKVWNVALTEDDITKDYALGRTGKSLTIADTSVCIGGGTAPNAQLDVRGSALVAGNLGIGTTNPVAQLHSYGNVLIGDRIPYNDPTHRDAQLMLCGTHNSAKNYNKSNQIKLLISGGDNESASPYYIMCEDENGHNQFWLKGSEASNGTAAKMFVNGSVGIGVGPPSYPLHVSGSAGNMPAMKYFNSSSSSLASGNNDAITIYANGNIYASGLVAASDERIKKEIVDANDAECLETLRLLKPKKYEYKDTINRGEEPVWGFIAQEVKETLPYATQLRQDVLPNIYELANVSSSNVITFTNFNTSNLESNATTLIRTVGIDGKDHDIHLKEVIDAHSIRVEEDLTDWIGSVDATGNVITEITTTTVTPEEYEALEDKTGFNKNDDDTYTKTSTTRPGNQLFVFGQEVDDFIFLKKEAIWTVATAALQEVDRQLQAEKAKVADLLARVTALENA
jgi:hypothetical protein